MSDAAPVPLVRSLAPEELARANLYGLIARLFHAAPDEQLLGEMLNAVEPHGEDAAGGDSRLDAAWRAVLEASRNAYPVMLENEHTALFLGAGKSEVTPYISNYVMKFESDTPLAELREALRGFGIARRAGVGEYEDHVSGVAETMRFIIATQQRSLEEQKVFFQRFVYPGVVPFCNAVSASNKASFYKHVAELARVFIEIENAAFEML